MRAMVHLGIATLLTLGGCDDPAPTSAASASAAGSVSAAPAAACSAGFTHCGGKDCARLQSDPRHCGSCDKHCLAGTCKSGSCVAGTRVAEEVYAHQLNLLVGDVLWIRAAGPKVAMHTLQGEVLKKNIPYENKLIPQARDESHLYGCRGEGKVERPAGLGDDERYGSCELLQQPLKGGTSKKLADVNLLVGDTLASDGTWVYFAVIDKDANSDAATIEGIELENGKRRVFARDQRSPADLAVDDKGVLYWANSGRDSKVHAILRVLPGGQPEVVVPKVSASHLAVGGGYLYFASGFEISRLPLSGVTSTPERVALPKANPKGNPHILGLEVTQSELFWAQSGSDVYRLDVWRASL